MKIMGRNNRHRQWVHLVFSFVTFSCRRQKHVVLKGTSWPLGENSEMQSNNLESFCVNIAQAHEFSWRFCKGVPVPRVFPCQRPFLG